MRTLSAGDALPAGLASQPNLVPVCTQKQSHGLGSDTSTSRNLVTRFFRAQPEHAICKSYPTGTAKNHQNSGDSKRPANVRMTIDEDSRDSESDTERHTKPAIHSPHIKKRCHKCPLPGFRATNTTSSTGGQHRQEIQPHAHNPGIGDHWAVGRQLLPWDYSNRGSGTYSNTGEHFAVASASASRLIAPAMSSRRSSGWKHCSV